MSLCMGCMQEIGNQTLCPECGFDNTEEQVSPFLPYKSLLAQRYTCGAAFDTNGESTRYIALDNHTGDVVIVNEFLPAGLISRNEKEIIVSLDDQADYDKLKENFKSYFKTVYDLKDLSAIVKILDIFEENNTVYVIEENEDLIPFEEYLERSNGSLDWDVARPLFMPIISALEALHKNGIGHYAIAPKNMFITSSGKIRMTGFATENERKRGTALKSQLFSGAAAPEQYDEKFPLDDITDIYGFCATLFYSLTGHLPKNAVDRLEDSRLLMSTSTVKRLPPHVVSALANGLQVHRENRITDFDELRSQLSVAHTAKAIQDEISRTASMNLPDSAKNRKDGVSHISVVVVSVAITILIVGLAGVFWLKQNPLANVFGGAVEATQGSTESTQWTGPTVPNYLGMKLEDAISSGSNENGITVYRNYTDSYSDQYAEGLVMAQYPAAGTKVDQEDGISVAITVSLGSQMRTLPNIDKLTLDEAAQMIADIGLLATVEYQNSETYAENRVMGYKSGAPGDSLEYGSTVVIIVSKGLEKSTTPTVANNNAYVNNNTPIF